MNANPAVCAIREALAEVDAIGAEKDQVMQEGVAMMDNLNCMDDCMAVHKQTMEKGTMFESYR